MAAGPNRARSAIASASLFEAAASTAASASAATGRSQCCCPRSVCPRNVMSGFESRGAAAAAAAAFAEAASAPAANAAASAEAHTRGRARCSRRSARYLRSAEGAITSPSSTTKRQSCARPAHPAARPADCTGAPLRFFPDSSTPGFEIAGPSGPSSSSNTASHTECTRGCAHDAERSGSNSRGAVLASEPEPPVPPLLPERSEPVRTSMPRPGRAAQRRAPAPASQKAFPARRASRSWSGRQSGRLRSLPPSAVTSSGSSACAAMLRSASGSDSISAPSTSSDAASMAPSARNQRLSAAFASPRSTRAASAGQPLTPLSAERLAFLAAPPLAAVEAASGSSRPERTMAACAKK
mmetsp:Transcript_32025/g.74732  ORF Transcript_32025/g.74732 Transcript_32025/m.74732 type:complete len:354 (+) Transcript_32025:2052-3113(+)